MRDSKAQINYSSAMWMIPVLIRECIFSSVNPTFLRISFECSPSFGGALNSFIFGRSPVMA